MLLLIFESSSELNMKIHVAETAIIELADVAITINVEDASKGDVISGKVLSVSRDSDMYKVGGVYEFSRNNIKQA